VRRVQTALLSKRPEARVTQAAAALRSSKFQYRRPLVLPRRSTEARPHLLQLRRRRKYHESQRRTLTTLEQQATELRHLTLQPEPRFSLGRRFQRLGHSFEQKFAACETLHGRGASLRRF
jgi:hypothetical protein